MSFNQDHKFDAGKLRMDLLPPEVLRSLAEIITYGADKYGAENWREVEPERYEAAMLRHLLAWKEGEIYDTESGFDHLKHVLCNAAFLCALEAKNEKNKNNTGIGDRPVYIVFPDPESAGMGGKDSKGE